MLKSIKRLIRKTGAPPGSLTYIGDAIKTPVQFSLHDFDVENYNIIECKNLKECVEYKNISTKSWMIVEGVHQPEIIEEIGLNFGIHTLTLEDIMNTGHLPKVEEFDEYLFIILKLPIIGDDICEIDEVQISMVCFENLVISFLESEDILFKPLKERIRTTKSRLRKKDTDYLIYAIIDSIIDNFYISIDKLSEKLEKIEKEIFINPSNSTLQNIHQIKQSLVITSKLIDSNKTIIDYLLNEDTEWVHEENIKYFRDINDHIFSVISSFEHLKEEATGLVDTYLSISGNKMNEVMKVLTIIATIFIPITFIAGIYGMNFSFMPELNWKYGYFVALGLMFVMVLVMMLFFKKRKWF